MAPSLESLPPELLDGVAEFCYADESDKEENILFRLRSTCRAVEAGTRHVWRRKYFSHRYLKLETQKLEQLKTATAIPEFAEAITCLEVECRDNTKLHGTLNNGDVPVPSLSELLQPFEQSLRCAFRNLTSLATIYFNTLESDTNDPWHAAERDTVDFSASFATVLKAVQDCNIRPTTILARASDKVRFGIEDCSMMLQLRECFSEVKELKLSFLFDSLLVNRPIDRTQLGQHLATGLNHFQSLTCLRLGFNWPDTVEIFDCVAATIFLPQLKVLRLWQLWCTCDALSAFLRKHARTLESCTLISPRFPELHAGPQAADRFSEVLKVLRSCRLLEQLVILWAKGLDCYISFPTARAQVSWSEEPNEDGFIEIEVDSSLLALEDEEIDEGISQVLGGVACI